MDRIRKYIVKVRACCDAMSSLLLDQVPLVSLCPLLFLPLNQAHMEFKFSEGPAKKVAVFEIMDALEKYAETHYAQIKEALKEKRQVRCAPCTVQSLGSSSADRRCGVVSCVVVQLSRQIEQVRRDIHKVKPAKSKFRKVAGALKSKFGGKKGADR